MARIGAARPARTSSRKAGSATGLAGTSIRAPSPGNDSASPTPSPEGPRQAQAGVHPALMGVEEMAVARAQVAARGGAAPAPQNELVAHELAVIFADRAWCGPIAGIRRVGAHRPFPQVAEHLPQPGAGGRAWPDR